MSVHYMGPQGPKQRAHHGQNDAFRGEQGTRTAKELEREKLRGSIHGENAHVPECLVWDVEDKSDRKHDGYGYGSPQSPRKDYTSRRTARGSEFSITSYKPLPRHPELGRPKNHLYGEDGPPDVHWKQRPDDGGVANAMVGWPETRREEEEWYRRSGMVREVDLGQRKGFLTDSSRRDCKGNCERKASMDRQNQGHHHGKGNTDSGCCDHRTCGCVPERQSHHQVTYEAPSYRPQQQQQQQQQHMQSHRFHGDNQTSNGFHVV